MRNFLIVVLFLVLAVVCLAIWFRIKKAPDLHDGIWQGIAGIFTILSFAIALGTAVATFLPNTPRLQQPIVTPTLPAPTATTMLPTATVVSPPPMAPTLPAPTAATMLPTTTVVSLPPATRPPAVTAAPTVSQLPQQALYQADFSTWPSSFPPAYRTSYTPSNREYHFFVDQRDRNRFILAPEKQLFGDFTLDIKGNRVSGSSTTVLGVVFRVQPLRQGDECNEYYVFTVAPSPSPALMSKFSLRRIGSGCEPEILQDYTPTPSILSGTSINTLTVICHSGRITLTVICQNGRITLKVNGTPIGDYPDKINKPGETGVAAGNGPLEATLIEAAFSSLTVRAP